ncbi:MAG: AraC family transcriptional regulator [Moraxellaceae bacterium]|nr:AraC family transcriptional regulator [Moraxellaceae bacterium]MDZ4297157.1 AraC family transcriptional regulator [Moraxellaceae bacterium]MDZ4387371.1 AraC family transcriptional regulator [Moraxellaceae bacterium]
MLQDDPRFTEAVIPTFVIAGLVDHAYSRGLEPEAWFAGQGLAVAQIQQSEALISFRQATTIIRRALRTLPTEPLGLHVGSREALTSFGMLGFAILSSQNVREAFATGLEFHLASGSLVDVEAEITATEVTLQLHERFPDTELLPFLCEEVFASSVAIMRMMLGNNTSPLRIELSYPQPAYGAAYQRLFKCPVRFNSSANRMVFSSALMDFPLTTRSAASHAAALAACRKLITPSVTTQDVINSVENLLRNHLRQRPTMTDIADWLNTTERTLRRQLTDVGQSFSNIRDRVLEQQARLLLSNSRLSISNIAEELGFSDPRDFRRAFRRWTGISPSRLRQNAPNE